MVSAQVESPPTDTAVTPLVSPETCTGTELAAWGVVRNSAPQHSTPPPAVRAQVAPAPSATAVTPLVSPETCTGTELLAMELLPSWPSVLLPQHSTPPPAVTAHAVAPRPTDTAV